MSDLSTQIQRLEALEARIAALEELLMRPDGTQRTVPIETIIRAVCEEFHLTTEELLANRRFSRIAWPRQVVMGLARTLTDMSLNEIAEAMGKKDHNTVFYAHTKMIDICSVDPEERRRVNRIRTAITSPKPT
jgi:chromosomal replication initiator protein